MLGRVFTSGDFSSGEYSLQVECPKVEKRHLAVFRLKVRKNVLIVLSVQGGAEQAGVSLGTLPLRSRFLSARSL
jgi:hypothetical protein